MLLVTAVVYSSGCSIVGCDRPLLFGNLSEDKNGNYLPPIAYVGVGLCAIFVLVGVAAVVMYGVRWFKLPTIFSLGLRSR